MRTVLKSVGVSFVAVVLLASTALALEQTNGTGKTNAGNSIGYNAKCTADLQQTLPDLGKYSCPLGDVTGHLTFTANNTNGITYVDPNTGLALKDIKCNDYTSYVFKDVGVSGPPDYRTRVTAAWERDPKTGKVVRDANGDRVPLCVATFEDGSTQPVFIKVYFYDNGEPGTADRIMFYATLDPAYAKNAELDPNRLVTDASGPPHQAGLISNGNVQIHTEVDPVTNATMLATDSGCVDPDTGDPVVCTA